MGMKRIKEFFRTNLWVALLDIIAVNGAYMLAILIRFYVHFKFTSGVGDNREYYLQFTPYYTVLCLITFAVCGLYDGMWRYAGLDDMNRIIWANLITAVIHVVGTKLFVHSMPTSYYLIGAFLQFLMIATIRFAYRYLWIAKKRTDKQRSWTIPAMVVGSGDSGKEFTRYLEDRSPFQVVAVVGEQGGKTMNGVPIVDFGSMAMQIKLHGVQTVFIADEGLSDARRDEVRRAAEGIQVKDYLEYLSSLPGHLPLSALMGVVEGPVTVSVDGVEREYATLQECQAALTDSYEVKAINGARIAVSRAAED